MQLCIAFIFRCLFALWNCDYQFGRGTRGSVPRKWWQPHDSGANWLSYSQSRQFLPARCHEWVHAPPPSLVAQGNNELMVTFVRCLYYDNCEQNACWQWTNSWPSVNESGVLWLGRVSLLAMPTEKSSAGMKGDKGNRLAVFQVSRVSAPYQFTVYITMPVLITNLPCTLHRQCSLPIYRAHYIASALYQFTRQITMPALLTNSPYILQCQCS